jgi:hypothetical protein
MVGQSADRGRSAKLPAKVPARLENPTGSDRNAGTSARLLGRHFPANRLAELGHPRDQNFGDSARGRRFENVNFPWDVHIEVTLLADWSAVTDGVVRAREILHDLAGGLNRAKKSRIAFGHRAPKCRSAIRRADPLAGRSGWVGRPTNFRPKFSVRPGRIGRSDRNGRNFRVTFWRPSWRPSGRRDRPFPRAEISGTVRASEIGRRAKKSVREPIRPPKRGPIADQFCAVRNISRGQKLSSGAAHCVGLAGGGDQDG